MTEENFKRLTNDGKTAVVISPEFGAGWYTWNREHPGLAFDGDIAQAVIDGDIDRAVTIAHERYGDFCDGGQDGLKVVWVKTGSIFWIKEYDGSESIKEYDGSESISVIGNRTYLTA